MATKRALEQASNQSSAKPFIKWVGGKRRVLPALFDRLPPHFNAYYEPFLGGGALFYTLQSRGVQAHLSDLNADLITTYKMVQNNLPQLITALQYHAACHSPTYYYEVRSQHQLTCPIDVAARFIYLLKTCFNGLYRVNRKNEFNTPIGSYVRPNIVDMPTLTAAHQVLQGVSLVCQSFSAIRPNAGDFVYFDPPYQGLKKDSFVGYSAGGFGPAEQEELRDFAVKLTAEGVHVMLSNADVPLIRDLYADGFTITTLQAPRLINCQAAKRQKVGELVITNY